MAPSDMAQVQNASPSSHSRATSDAHHLCDFILDLLKHIQLVAIKELEGAQGLDLTL